MERLTHIANGGGRSEKGKRKTIQHMTSDIGTNPPTDPLSAGIDGAGAELWRPYDHYDAYDASDVPPYGNCNLELVHFFCFWTHFSCVSQLYAATQTPCTVLYVVPMLIGC